MEIWASRNCQELQRQVVRFSSLKFCDTKGIPNPNSRQDGEQFFLEKIQIFLTWRSPLCADIS
jgi:hypothetical protein